MFFRGGIQASVSALFIMRDRRMGDTTKLFGDTNYTSLVLLARTILGFVGMAFSFLAVEYMPVADASVLVMQSPVLAAILSYFILGEPWRLAEFIATIISMIGVVMISRPSFLWKFIDPTYTEDEVYSALGPVYGMLGALGAGGAFVSVRMLGTTAKMPWPNVTFAASLGQFLLSAPMIFLSGQTLRLDIAWWKWALLLTGGVVGTFSQFAMTIGAIKVLQQIYSFHM
jgi:drug/metabolite transporter (DMT)-like permease